MHRCLDHASQCVQGLVNITNACLDHALVMLRRDADLLVTMTDAQDDMQLYWEAFPAAGGAMRTTYMFTYADADRRRPSFEVRRVKDIWLCPLDNHNHYSHK